MSNSPTPQFVHNINNAVLLEPLSGPAQLDTYLDRFPETLYTRAPDSHFMHFMLAILGMAGTGWLRINYLVARLELEANGANNVALDSFYADPFTFGRILDEISDDDLGGLLPSATWDQIRTADESYRSRAIEFLHAARFGTNPLGMKLAASSGAGQSVAIYENYQWLFDNHSDDALYLPHYGRTTALGEFTVVPRQPISESVQQTIDLTPLIASGGSFTVNFAGYHTASLPQATTAADLQADLWALSSIGNGNVLVSGGPGTLQPYVVTFTADLSNQPVPDLLVHHYAPTTGVTTVVPPISVTGAIDPSSEAVVFSTADSYLMQEALDRLRPVASYPTFTLAAGSMAPRAWTGLLASTAYTKVVRFVTGSASVAWPDTDSVHWIEPAIELEAPQLQDGVQAHYTSFHNVASVVAYTDAALLDPDYGTATSILPTYVSMHVGLFPEMTVVMPYFNQFTKTSDQFAADRVLSPTPDLLSISAVTSSGVALINNIYPIDYLGLQGVPTLPSGTDLFWSSSGRASGTDLLEIDLGVTQAVNYISFEITGKPIDIAIHYDLLDQAPTRSWQEVTPMLHYPEEPSVYYDPTPQSPWRHLTYWFNDGEAMIFTRFIRLSFTRRASHGTGFLLDPVTQLQTAYSIDVRNLRIGRNVSPTLT